MGNFLRIRFKCFVKNLMNKGNNKEKDMEIRLADYVAEFLTSKNVKHMFSVPGGGAMHLNDAFGHKEGLKVIYNHHEQACSIAAEGYVRATGEIPAVCVTTGPGGTNALTGVMGSYLDSIPMFVISGQVKFTTTIKSCPDIALRQLGDQEFNIVDCVKSMTKYAVMVTEPESIKYHLEKAWFEMVSGRKGPVWLDIPINVQSAKIDPEKLIGFDEKKEKTPTPSKPEKALLEEVLKEINSAKKPVILLGEANIIAGLREEMKAFLDKVKIPVVTAWNAHDLLEDDNPYYCGRPGSVGTRGGNIVLQSSDLLLSLGCRMNIRQISYNYENFAKNARLIAVDIDKAELDKPTLSVDTKIHADLKDFYEVMSGLEYTPNANHEKWLAHCKEVNEKYPAAAPEYYEKQTPVNPYVFMKELSEILDDGQKTVCGNGSACVCSFQAMKIKKNQRLYTNSGCASMGYGLPAAIGACFAVDNKENVICLDGDGSVQMNIQELQTMYFHNLNVKLFWLNNDGYHSMRQTQTNIFNKNFTGVNADSGISFPEAERIAFAYKIPYFKIEKVSDIGVVCEKVLKVEGPVICEVVLDDAQFFTPKLSSRIMPDGKIVSPSLEDMFPFIDRDELDKAMNPEL